MFRSIYCGELGASNVGEVVTLSGWVNRRRDHGGLIFVDLRDRSGLVQIVFDPEVSTDNLHLAEKIRSEFVIKVTGKVRPRKEGAINPNLKTGEIEVLITEVEILNEAKVLPFEVNLPLEFDDKKNSSEDLRLKYRYLDLRREKMKNNIGLRYKVIKDIRDYMDEAGFWEIETPILVKGTPEGAREYLVPARLYPGKFYVLPQSPQQMKQLLMVSGMDKYFQIARCFRDEDQRGDRQPEFTQLDIELSFPEEKDIFELIEKLLLRITEKFAPQKQIQNKPFPILDYEEVMLKYGSDKPDLRFDLEIKEVSDYFKDSEFNAFKTAEFVRALKVPGGAKFTRKELDELTEVAKIYRAKGLAYITCAEELKSPILKFLTKGEAEKIVKDLEAKTGDIIFFVADSKKIVEESLGALRIKVAEKLNLIDPNLFSFLWVRNFPMFEQDEETGKLNSMHHPFTRPAREYEDSFETNPLGMKAVAYDVVLNGSEVGGGSIRIHERSIQEKVFKALDISMEDALHRFGHILEAFEYGAPPHGGIALGLDRLVMILCDEANIREVMAFPKDGKAKDLMFGAPSDIPEKQVKEANIRTLKEGKN